MTASDLPPFKYPFPEPRLKSYQQVISRRLFLHECSKDRLARENETFDSLDVKYTEFMLLGFENPDVITEILAPKTRKYNARQVQKQKALLAVLFSLFERVFVMFEGQHSDFRLRQWEGWVLFIRSYTSGAVFRREWDVSGNQFDSNFQTFMNELLKRTE